MPSCRHARWCAAPSPLSSRQGATNLILHGRGPGCIRCHRICLPGGVRHCRPYPVGEALGSPILHGRGPCCTRCHRVCTPGGVGHGRPSPVCKALRSPLVRNTAVCQTAPCLLAFVDMASHQDRWAVIVWWPPICPHGCLESIGRTYVSCYAAAQFVRLTWLCLQPHDTHAVHISFPYE